MVDPINYKHQVMAVVVVHQPDWQDVLANIDTYLSAVDTLCVVANSPLTDTQTADLADRQLHLIQNRDNLGVASALNQAAERAESMGYRWFLRARRPLGRIAYIVQNLFRAFIQCPT
jgi:rhamnosyltransferase